MNFIVVAIGILLAVILVLVLIMCFQKKKIEQLKDTVEIKKRAYENLFKEYMQMKEEEIIKKENRKEADEKKNDLFNGNPVDNAIDGLSKH